MLKAAGGRVKKIFLAVLFCFLSLPSYAVFYGPYALIAPTAIDGDTIRADVPVWPGVNIDASIRVIGVDTPELNIACEKELAIAAKAFTEAWINRNSPVVVGSVKPDKYSGRYDAIVTGAGGERLSTALIQSGHGRPYNGGKRQSWCQ